VDGDHLGDEEIFACFQLLLLAGHETTTNLLGNAVLAFAEAPSLFTAVAGDPAAHHLVMTGERSLRSEGALLQLAVFAASAVVEANLAGDPVVADSPPMGPM
jgi:cytochrome P450